MNENSDIPLSKYKPLLENRQIYRDTARKIVRMIKAGPVVLSSPYMKWEIEWPEKVQEADTPIIVENTNER